MPIHPPDAPETPVRPIPPRALRQLLDFLTDVHPDVRQESLADARRVLTPPRMAQIVDGLIERLKHGKDGMPTRAAEALAGLGPAALLPVAEALVHSRSPYVGLRLVQVFSSHGLALATEPRERLIKVLELVANRTGSGALSAACHAAIIQLQQAAPASPEVTAGTPGPPPALNDVTASAGS
jgi:hypothetical protein